MFGLEKITLTSKCNHKVDIFFIIDSTNSMKHFYSYEKYFLKSLSAATGISEDGTHASVVTYSTDAHFAINFTTHSTVQSFHAAADRLPFLGGKSRIDRALSLIRSVMFPPHKLGREDASKMVVVVTDGIQSNTRNAEDPAMITRYLSSN